MEKKVINVYTESNPNPNSLKFCVEFLLLPEGQSVDFPDADSAKTSPLATDLFMFSNVKRVFISANFITITKDEASNWDDIIPILKAFIKGYLEEGKPLFYDKNTASSNTSEEESEIVVRIKTLLDEYVRPAVEQDGGAITFDSFNEGLVKVHLQGSCSGCPSSTVTLKQGIENLLTRLVPEVKSVEAVGV
ncbi:MAG: NifU family protein [Cytophagales bacterium]